MENVVWDQNNISLKDFDKNFVASLFYLLPKNWVLTKKNLVGEKLNFFQRVLYELLIKYCKMSNVFKFIYNFKYPLILIFQQFSLLKVSILIFLNDLIFCRYQWAVSFFLNIESQ